MVMARKQRVAVLFGEAISKKRLEQELRLVDLSLLSGVALATLSDMENGVRDTRVSTYQRVFDALNIDLAEVFYVEKEEIDHEAGYDLFQED